MFKPKPERIRMKKIAEITDLTEEHSTKMIFGKVEFNTGISDKTFTQRHLKRGK